SRLGLPSVHSSDLQVRRLPHASLSMHAPRQPSHCSREDPEVSELINCKFLSILRLRTIEAAQFFSVTFSPTDEMPGASLVTVKKPGLDCLAGRGRAAFS